MTNFEKITASPEALGSFLDLNIDSDGPWDDAFHAKYCAKCDRENCEPCPHEEQRHNPLWWLKQEERAGGERGTGE